MKRRKQSLSSKEQTIGILEAVARLMTFIEEHPISTSYDCDEIVMVNKG